MVDVLSWGVLVRGKFKLKVDLSVKTPWQKYRAVEGFKWWTRTIRTISQREQVFIQEGVCFTVCSSGTSGPPYMKNSMKMSSFERYRISIHFFLIEKFTSFFKRKWGNRLMRECEAVPFFSRTKTYIPIKYEGNLRLLVVGDNTSERNTYHQSLRT